MEKLRKKAVAHANQSRVSTRLFVAMLLSLLIFVGCNSEKRGSQEENVSKAVLVQQIKVQTVRETVDFLGTIGYDTEVTVVSRTTGTIETLPVDEGDKVKRNRVVAKISEPIYNARMAKVSAQIEKFENEEDYFCDLFAKNSDLYKSGMVSKTKLDSAERGCLNAKSGKSVAESEQRELKVVMSHTVERAPHTGILLIRLLEKGQHVFPGKPIVKIGSGPKIVRVEVHNDDISAGIIKNMEVQIGGNSKNRGIVKWIAPIAKGPQQTVTVEISLSKQMQKTLRYGKRVPIYFIQQEAKNALTVPERAIVKKHNKTYIFLAQDNRAKRVEVTTGIQEDGWVSLKKGDISKEALVIISTTSSITDGMVLYVVSDDGGGS